MKTLSLLLITLFFTISAIAQPWLGNVPGNIYYNQGNVGIGTAGSTYHLQIESTANNQLQVTGQGAGYGGTLLTNIYSERITSGAVGLLKVGSAYAPSALYVETSGNVGIGTTNPTLATLQIAGSVLSTTGINVSGIGGFYNAANKFGIDVNGATSRFYASGADGTTPGNYEFHVIASDGTPDAIAMAINSSGNVGIGTTSPGATLDLKSSNGSYVLKVVTSASANTALSIGGSSDINGVTTGYEAFTILNIGEDSGSQRSIFAAGNIKTGRNLTAGGVLTLRGTDNSSIAGNVSIGTTTPDPNAKLTVKGKIVASEIQVKADNLILPDYVFKSDYELMSLEKVEEFVKQNQHLPEVPSEKEFKKDGMNVAEMNALLLKKIEELTLYAIEQNKKIEALEKTVNNLISK